MILNPYAPFSETTHQYSFTPSGTELNGYNTSIVPMMTSNYINLISVTPLDEKLSWYKIKNEKTRKKNGKKIDHCTSYFSETAEQSSFFPLGRVKRENKDT